MDDITRMELENEVNPCDDYTSMIIAEYEYDNKVKLSEKLKEKIYERVNRDEVYEECEYNGGYSNLCDKMLMDCVKRVVNENRQI